MLTLKHWWGAVRRGFVASAMSAASSDSARCVVRKGDARELTVVVAAMDTPKTLYADAGDVSIAYQVLGEGPIDIVYVPGWVSNIEVTWEDPSFARMLRHIASFSGARGQLRVADPVVRLPVGAGSC